MRPAVSPEDNKDSMKNFFWAAGSVIVAVLLSFLIGNTVHPFFGAITSPATNLDYLQLSQGLAIPAGPSVSTTVQGTNVQGIWDGTCTIFAYSATIVASTTADVECQAGAATLTALTGVTLGDRVFMTLSTSTPTTSNGLVIESASASTTAGYIHMKISNLTGANFTWTPAASSSVSYLDIR